MVKSAINADLAGTLDVVAASCAALQDDWWVFGGAAMALAGVPDLSPPDVDLIVSERDAQSLIDQHSVVRRAKMRGLAAELPVLVDFSAPNER